MHWNAFQHWYLRYSVCVCACLSLHSYFSFYSFSFAFLHLRSHTSICANHWHLCWLYRQGPMLLQIGNPQKTALSQMRVQSHTCPLAEGYPRVPIHDWSCQTQNSVAKLTSLGVSKALPGLHIQGGKGLLDFAEPLSTDCSWILGPIFSGAFKARTNNTKLKVRGSHQSSPSHLTLHVLSSLSIRDLTRRSSHAATNLVSSSCSWAWSGGKNFTTNFTTMCFGPKENVKGS